MERCLDLGFLRVRVFEGKREEWGRRRNTELGAVVAPRRRWREGIGKGRKGEGGEEKEEDE